MGFLLRDLLQALYDLEPITEVVTPMVQEKVRLEREAAEKEAADETRAWAMGSMAGSTVGSSDSNGEPL